MANTGIKFYSKAFTSNENPSTFSTENLGSIVFDKTSKAIYVKGVKYGGSNVADATYSSNILTITKVSGDTISLDFSTLATVTSVETAFNEIKGYLTMDDGAGTYVANTDDTSYVSSDTLTNVNTTNLINTTGSDADMVDVAVAKVDKKAKAILGEVIDAKREIDAIETGAGLGTNGSYTANTSTNYIYDATSLKNADEKLDAAIKSVSDAVGNAVTDVKVNNTSVVTNHVADIAVDGIYNASTNQIATVSTVTDAIAGLDVPAGAITGMGAGKTISTLTETDGKISATFRDIEINGSQVSGLTGYDVSGATGDVSSSDSLITALEKIEAKANNAGVTTFGGETGAITLGSYLTMGSGNNDHQLSVTNVDTAGTSTTDTDLATVKTVSNAINALDTTNDITVASTDSTNHTVTITGSVKETDGIISDGTADDVTLYFASEQSSSNKIVTMAEIADLSGAMHFRSIIDTTSTEPIDAINSYYSGNVPSAEVGDVFVDSHTGKEYVVKSLPSSGNLTNSNIEEFGSVNPETTVTSFAASTSTTGLVVTPTTSSTGAISMTVNTDSGYQIPTSAQLTKVDSIAVNTTNKSVTDGTNTLSDIVSDANYAHITVTPTSVSDGTNTFSQYVYVHPTTTAASAAAVKVGKDTGGHVVLGDALSGSDISYTNQNMSGITTVAGALDSLQSTSGSALQSISHGTDGTYVTTTIGTKSNNDQSVGVAVTIQSVSTADSTKKGLAEASDVKSYVDGKVAVVDGTETVVVNDSTATTIATVGGNNIQTKVAFYWEAYE